MKTFRPFSAPKFLAAWESTSCRVVRLRNRACLVIAGHHSHPDAGERALERRMEQKMTWTVTLFDRIMQNPCHSRTMRKTF